MVLRKIFYRWTLIWGQKMSKVVSTLSGCSAVIFEKFPNCYYQKITEPKYFDFIVVGAGTAGCVVGNRLTENDWNVLLLEAGTEEPVAAQIPGFTFNIKKTAIDWNYTSQAEQGSCLLKKGCSWSSGKVMGGTSTINGMMYARGNPLDYDNWANHGNTGWTYKEILPYFMKSEDNRDPELAKQNPGYHGTGGYLAVSKYPFLSEAGKKIEEAYNEIGYATIDTNGKSQLGVNSQTLTTENGVRESTNAAFIRPIRGKRPNLIIRNEVYVTRILIDPITKKATGVEYKCTRTGITEVVMARKEIIVSAGAMNSPRLLMVSGVGPVEELKKHKISVIQNLSVGHNLQDHFATSGITGITKNVTSDNNVRECKQRVEDFQYYAKTKKGPLSAIGPACIMAYVRTEYEKNPNLPDIQLQSLATENKFYIKIKLLTSESRGLIKLNPTDPIWGPPLIYPRYLTAEPDIKRMIQGIRIGLSVFDTKVMKNTNYELDKTPLPPCDNIEFNSDDYWTCVLRQLGTSSYHPVGTCKMGPKEDLEAVVDPRLRVYGIEGLRVIDASVMTVVPRGNIMAPTLMIAEKACDMIKEDYGMLTRVA